MIPDYSARLPRSQRRSALEKRTVSTILDEPFIFNNEYQRYFTYTDQNGWDLSAYDPLVVGNTVSLQEVQTFLNKLVAMPLPQAPACFILCPGDYPTKIEGVISQMNTLM